MFNVDELNLLHDLIEKYQSELEYTNPNELDDYDLLVKVADSTFTKINYNLNNNIKDKLLDAILLWIGHNYGSQEMEDPCYDIESMVNKIIHVMEGGE